MIVHVYRTVLIGLVTLAPLLMATPSSAATDEVGRATPALVVKQLDGRELDLTALRGKVVILNIWATWCPPCRAEMPMLDAFYRQHQSEGVVLVGLSADELHDRKDVVKVMQGLAYPAALLKEAKVNGFGAPRALPITYVIDADGIMRARRLPGRGPLTEAELTGLVVPLLVHSEVSAPQ